MSPDAVSVVIPLYNKARHIKRALDSVLAQAHREFEVIVVNDGSTDGSEAVVRSCSDPRVRLLSQANAGVSAARNRGIAEARAGLVAFLDADDRWLPGHLKNLLGLSRRFPDCGACATAYCFVAEDRKLYLRSYPGIPAAPWAGLVNYFRTDPVHTSAVAVRRGAFDAVGGFKPGAWFSEDTDMWCRIALRFPVACTTRVGTIVHLDADNRVALTANLPECRDWLPAKTLGAALRAGRLPPGVSRGDVAEFLNRRFLLYAGACVARGDRRKARGYLHGAAGTRSYRRLWLRLWVDARAPAGLRPATAKLWRLFGL